MAFRVIACFLILAFCANSSWADEILGCGGFVEASSSLIKLRKSSDAKLDYSHITVELRTVDGLLKDWTQCAPNGYYFIPVYDKGSFVLKIKGPEGWSWHPDNVPVIIDNFGCNANQDINFQFTGFTISGRILGAVGGESCSLKDAGPSGVKVELLSLEGDVISSAISSPVGKYSFTNIIPGKYQLHGSHPNLKIEVRGSPEIDLGFGNELVNDIFFIPGYDIHGSVVAQDNPILGVQVFLYSEDVSEVHCPRTFAETLEQKNSLCHAVSDADGKFSFHLIPCGVYKLLPYYKGENTVFDISPPSMTVSVEQNHVTVLQKFQVTGFSVGGRVVDDNGVGVVGAKVIVDGQERAITDSHGYYKLDQVTSRHYSIGAEKAHYKFKSLQKFLVLPNMDLIADIEATHYDICGFVRLVHSDARVKVALTHGPENIKPQVKWADVDGNFCFEVPPGEYRLSAFASSQETASGLLFLPDYIDVAVHSPILDIEFSQALVDIRGMVLCKEKCGSTVHVSLTRLSSRSTEKPRTITLSDEGAEFSFSKVVPGKHRLEVKHETSPEQDNWCWEQSSIDFDVGTEDRKGITFVQKGYWINIFSTHDVDARIQQPDSSFFDLHIKKGSQKICVESYGKYELQFVNSCLFFGGESVKFHSSNPLPIYLTATKYLIKGEIHIDPGFNLSSLSDGIIVDVLNGENSVVDSIHTRYVSEGNQGEVAVFEYSFWANNGDDLIFAPQDLREVKENRILFYPKQKHVSVMDYGCQASVSPFVGRVGLYVSGSVSPAVSDVQIRIIAATESKNTPLKKGELAFETITDSDGIFVGGPLYDDASYIVEASKPGYHLKPSGKNSFICQKLGQISVHLYSSEELPFPSVLLSLSGENGYRNNSVTGVGGFFIFDSLFPGSYYLRPLLKEYSFSPSTQAIELGSGEAKEIVFHATRVAYSAMGTVSLLAGQSKEGIVVEARSEAKGYYEQTTTDSLGNYRLRGLLPDTTYVIKVASREDSGSIRLERASPESISVQVALGDIKELDFVVFEQPEITILTGHVEGNGLLELQPHLSVEIMSVNDPSNVKVVIPLPLSYYFQVRGLSKAKHLVQLRSSLPSSNQKFESEAIEVDLEKQPQIHIGPLTFKTRECHQKADLTPAPVLPLIVGVSVITLFVAMPRLKDVYQSVISSPLGSTTSSSKKETIRKPILRKRTY